MTGALPEKPHGRLVWFDSFIFGRKLNFVVRCISQSARLKTSKVLVDGELSSALRFVDSHLRSSRPAKVRINMSSPWIVFTDGAFELTQSKPGRSVVCLSTRQGWLWNSLAVPSLTNCWVSS